MPAGHLPFFGNMCIEAFCPFLIEFFIVFFLKCCMSCLHILDVNLLSVILFVNIFSHAVGRLFVLLMISFVVQRLLRFFRSFFVFNFWLYVFCLRKDRR